ncbi:MAG: porin family protein [Chlorobiaceae bacterium]|nr:porin family protein [Chlorobiaceae bacterium]
MKKYILPLVVAGCFAVPSIAGATSNPYVSLSGGVGLMTNSTYGGLDDAYEYETGYLVNAAIGLKSGAYRVEAEIGYHQNDFKYYSDYNLTAWSFMANGYYDIGLSDSNITPYIMGGLGIANVNWEYSGGNDDDTTFAWQVGAGVGFKAADKVTIDIGYRYFATTDVELYGYDLSVGSHNIVAGVRFDL